MIHVPRKRKCRRHVNRALIPTQENAEGMIIDLVFTKNGCRKVIIKYVGKRAYCPLCKLTYVPPAVGRVRNRPFGHAFKAWGVYQRVAMRSPYELICELYGVLFSEQLTATNVVFFLRQFAEMYSITETSLLSAILNGPVIHVDETKISIEGIEQYAWVLTDGQHVVFRLTATREASFLQKMLENYKGVLISDFYGGYDPMPCRQQKCLVHLIRDLNDDLWKNPFLPEYEMFISRVRDLLVPIFNDVEQYGLTTRHLRKHIKSVDRFYRQTIEGVTWQSEIIQTYQKRFLRYRESLFLFLTDDGIPWNNNMAERAIRHLAVQRKISGSFSVKGAADYLALLGIAQSCRFQDKSFLRFLLSEEKDVDAFKDRKRRR